MLVINKVRSVNILTDPHHRIFIFFNRCLFIFFNSNVKTKCSQYNFFEKKHVVDKLEILKLVTFINHK